MPPKGRLIDSLKHFAGPVALICVLALAALVLEADPTSASPAADVSAYRAAQGATQTATPRIQLPTETRAATGTATVASGTSTAAAGVTPTVDGPAGTADSTVDATDSPGGGTVPGAPPGSTPGTPPPGLGPNETAQIAPPALPGTAEPGSGAGGIGNVPPSAGAAGLEAREDDTISEAPGPSGLIRVPVTDPVVREMWSRFGSPRSGQAPLDRLTSGKPLPWSAWPFYLLLLGLFAFALWRAIHELRLQDRAAVAADTDGDHLEEGRDPDNS